MLDSLFSAAQDRTKRFVVYADRETDVEGLFANHSVDVDRRNVPPGGPDPFLVIEEAGQFAGAIALADLDGLLEPPVARPGEWDDVSPGYRVLFEVLDEQVFTALERSQLLAVTREIEDRAVRVGSGELRATFQTRSSLESAVELYRYLGSETDLDVHVHGAASWTVPSIPGVTYHTYPGDVLDQYWVLAFDGGPDDSQASCLLAREQPDGYEGLWTNDAAIVERTLDVLQAV